MSAMPEIGRRGAIEVEVEACKYWCTCKRSSHQPLSDASHKKLG